MTVALLQLKGNAVWICDKKRPGQVPDQIWVFDHERFEPLYKKGSRIIESWKWEYKSGSFRALKPWQVCFFHLSNPDPNEPFWGASPLQAAMSGVRQDWFASRFNEAFFKNAANPGGVLRIKEQVGDDEYKALKSQFRSQYTGETMGFKTLFLRGEVEYEQLKASHDDMAFVAGKKLTREEICGVFHVPPSEVGIFEQVHKATSSGLQKQFWEGTIKPILRLIELVLDAQLFVFLDDDVTGQFNLKGVEALQEDRNSKVDRADKLKGMGVPFYLINEMEGLGYPRFNGDDVGHLPVSLRPLDVPWIMPGTTAGGGVEDGGDNDEKAFRVWQEPKRQIAGPGKEWHAKAIEPQSEAHAAYLAVLEELLEEPQRKFKRGLRTYLMRVRTEVLRRLRDATLVHGTASVPESALDIPPALDEALRKLARRHYRSVGEAVGPMIERELNEIPGISYEFRLGDGRVAEYLKTKEVLIKGINDRVREKVRETLVESQMAGDTLGEVQERIVNVIGDERSRALTIARTETIQAAGGMKYHSELDAGVKLHQWVATLSDDKTRPTHLENMSLGPWPVRKRFPNGCLYPGDTTCSDPAEYINCRCWIYAVE